RPPCAGPSVSVHSCSSPNVSKRNTRLPSAISAGDLASPGRGLASDDDAGFGVASERVASNITATAPASAPPASRNCLDLDMPRLRQTLRMGVSALPDAFAGWEIRCALQDGHV